MKDAFASLLVLKIAEDFAIIQRGLQVDYLVSTAAAHSKDKTFSR